MAQAYRHDLAYVHDVGFREWATSAAGVLLRTLRDRGIREGLVVDLGCGTGVLGRELADAGYSILGVDQSADMIALARARVPEAQFRVASFLSVDLPPAVAVAAVGEIFNYLFDEANDQQALAATVRRVYDALHPDGVLLFDMAGPGRVPGPGPARTFREGADWAILVETEEDDGRGLLTRRCTTFRRVGGSYRRDSETHRLRLVGADEVVPLLQEVGFDVRVLETYGELSFPPGVLSYLATK